MNHATTLPYKPIETSIPLHYDDCSYRLPCGYCRMLMRDCPKYYTMTWTGGDPNIKVTL